MSKVENVKKVGKIALFVAKLIVKWLPTISAVIAEVKADVEKK